MNCRECSSVLTAESELPWYHGCIHRPDLECEEAFFKPEASGEQRRGIAAVTRRHSEILRQQHLRPSALVRAKKRSNPCKQCKCLSAVDHVREAWRMVRLGDPLVR